MTAVQVDEGRFVALVNMQQQQHVCPQAPTPVSETFAALPPPLRLQMIRANLPGRTNS